MGVSSVKANAEEVSHNAYHIYTVAYCQSASGAQTIATGMHYPKDSTRQNIQGTKSVYTPTGGAYCTLELYIANSDKTVLWDSGSIVTGKLENIYFTGSVAVTGIATYPLNISRVQGNLLYSDSTTETITASVEKDRNGYYLINYDFTADKDVSQIYFQLFSEDLPSTALGKSVTVTMETGEPTLEQEVNTNIVWGSLASEIQSEESGWLAKIWQKLTNGFSEMVDAITGLPAKIWGYIEDGLKSLFIPDEEFIVSYKEKWEELLADKFGAVYQVVNVTLESWDRITNSDETNAIEFPKVTIPLPDDNEFSFGGYDVKIVPDGFGALATACKMIAGIVCTILFVNGLRKRYDEVMGVEQ